MSDEDTKCWIYAGGLPYDLTEGDVLCVFSQFGEIFKINLSRDKETGKSKGFCFIKYEDKRSCELAVDNLNGIKIIGRTIKVHYANNTTAIRAMQSVSVGPQDKDADQSMLKIKNEDHKDNSDSDRSDHATRYKPRHLEQPRRIRDRSVNNSPQYRNSEREYRDAHRLVSRRRESSISRRSDRHEGRRPHESRHSPDSEASRDSRRHERRHKSPHSRHSDRHDERKRHRSRRSPESPKSNDSKRDRSPRSKYSHDRHDDRKRHKSPSSTKPHRNEKGRHKSSHHRPDGPHSDRGDRETHHHSKRHKESRDG